MLVQQYLTDVVIILLVTKMYNSYNVSYTYRVIILSAQFLRELCMFLINVICPISQLTKQAYLQLIKIQRDSEQCQDYSLMYTQRDND